MCDPGQHKGGTTSPCLPTQVYLTATVQVGNCTSTKKKGNSVPDKAGITKSPGKRQGVGARLCTAWMADASPALHAGMVGSDSSDTVSTQHSKNTHLTDCLYKKAALTWKPCSGSSHLSCAILLDIHMPWNTAVPSVTLSDRVNLCWLILQSFLFFQV